MNSCLECTTLYSECDVVWLKEVHNIQQLSVESKLIKKKKKKHFTAFVPISWLLFNVMLLLDLSFVTVRGCFLVCHSCRSLRFIFCCCCGGVYMDQDETLHREKQKQITLKHVRPTSNNSHLAHYTNPCTSTFIFVQRKQLNVQGLDQNSIDSKELVFR